MSGSVSPPLPSNTLVPLFYARFDGSNAGVSQTQQNTLLMGHALPAAAAPEVPTQVFSPVQAIALFGAGSMLAQMFADYAANDQWGSIWCLPVPEPSGGTKASLAVTITGTATAAGVLALYVAGKLVQVGVSVGDTASVVAGNIVAAIGAFAAAVDPLGLPVTAAASAGVVTLTAVHAGLPGNTIDARLNYGGTGAGQATPAGITVAIPVLSGTDVSELTSGAGVPTLTGLAALLGGQNFDFIASPFRDTASLAVISALLNNVSGRWSPQVQLFGHHFTAACDTAANLVTYAGAGALNDPHLTAMGMFGCPNPVWSIAAIYAGAAATSLRALASQPLQTVPLVGLLAPKQDDQFSTATANTLLNNGVAQAQWARDNTGAIMRAVTTFQLNQYGQASQAYLDTETCFTLMVVSRAYAAMWTSKYPRAILMPDGTHVGPGVPIITPKIAMAEIAALYLDLEDQGLLQNAAGMIAATTAVIDPNDPSRLDIGFVPYLASGLRIIDMLNQFRLLAAPAA